MAEGSEDAVLGRGVSTIMARRVRRRNSRKMSVIWRLPGWPARTSSMLSSQRQRLATLLYFCFFGCVGQAGNTAIDKAMEGRDGRYWNDQCVALLEGFCALLYTHPQLVRIQAGVCPS